VKIQGTVTKVVAGRGFYFITGDDAAQYFLHISEMERAGLNEPAIGDRLSFDVQVNNKGPRVGVAVPVANRALRRPHHLEGVYP